jgi:hypothetical protein
MSSCNSNTILTGPENTNYLATNYFKFLLKRIPNFEFFVQSANLPMMSTRAINQPTTLGTFPKIPATNFYFDDLMVNFMVNNDMKNWIEIYDWMKGIGNLKTDYNNLPYDPADPNGVFSTATLIVTNSQYAPLMQAVFYYVFPRSLGGINFTSQNTSTDPVSCTVNFSYSYYEVFPIGGEGYTN